MKALVLAAGRGSRLRPLTDLIPKPLLEVNGRHLCDWQLAACKRAGVTQIVMNTAHLADAFEDIPAQYAQYGFEIALSREGNSAADALESLGGIVNALPLLTDGTEPFLVLAGDVVHDMDLTRLTEKAEAIRSGVYDAYLVAVPNPEFHLKGDLTVFSDSTVIPGPGPHTYACLMIVSPRIFSGLDARPSKLFPWLWEQNVRAEVFKGFWGNVGTPHELEILCENKNAMRLVDF